MASAATPLQPNNNAIATPKRYWSQAASLYAVQVFRAAAGLIATQLASGDQDPAVLNGIGTAVQIILLISGTTIASLTLLKTSFSGSSDTKQQSGVKQGIKQSLLISSVTILGLILTNTLLLNKVISNPTQLHVTQQTLWWYTPAILFNMLISLANGKLRQTSSIWIIACAEILRDIMHIGFTQLATKQHSDAAIGIGIFSSSLLTLFPVIPLLMCFSTCCCCDKSSLTLENTRANTKHKKIHWKDSLSTAFIPLIENGANTLLFFLISNHSDTALTAWKLAILFELLPQRAITASCNLIRASLGNSINNLPKKKQNETDENYSLLVDAAVNIVTGKTAALSACALFVYLCYAIPSVFADTIQKQFFKSSDNSSSILNSSHYTIGFGILHMLFYAVSKSKQANIQAMHAELNKRTETDLENPITALRKLPWVSLVCSGIPVALTWIVYVGGGNTMRWAAPLKAAGSLASASYLWRSKSHARGIFNQEISALSAASPN